MEYGQALKWIEKLPRFSQGGPSLQRIHRLLKELGHPEREFAVVHIAGTNGKGSTAAMIARALQLAGYRTGLYLSPGVLDFRERIQVQGQMIRKTHLAAWTERMEKLLRQVEDVNQSEFLTAVAYGYMAEQNCDIGVIETGMGGRWDATNILTKPAVSVITKIGLDHTAILGNTLAEIAEEKSGIFKTGCPAVICPGQRPEAMAVIRREAAEKQCPLYEIKPEQIQIREMGLDGTRVLLDGQPFFIGMPGRYQTENGAAAVTACRVLQQQGWHKLTEEIIRQALETARMPARMELLSRQPLILLDGAHNPQGGQALAQALRELAGDRPLLGVVGVMADKDSDRLLEFLKPHLQGVLCVTPGDHRALPAEQLVKRGKKLGLWAEAADSISSAWEKSCRWAEDHSGGVIWCGSLHLAADVHHFLQGES